MSTKKVKRHTLRERVYRTLSPESKGYKPSKIFNSAIIILIVINLAIIILETFSSLPESLHTFFYVVEVFSVAVFTIEYLLRLWTADMLYPDLSPVASRIRFVFSITSIFDLLAISPFYMQIFSVNLSVDLIALRMLRLLHIIRVFEPHNYSSPFAIVENVIRKKSRQIMSSVVFVFTLMVTDSILMYGAEHTTQPEVFRNAFSGIRWMLTNMTPIHFGNIALLTGFGKFLGVIMVLLTIGLVVLPIGIICSGFVEEQGDMRVKKFQQNRALGKNLAAQIPNQIDALFELKEKGAISEEEFSSKKSELLLKM